MSPVQHDHEPQAIHTNGGAAITGNITTQGGDFIGRDQIIAEQILVTIQEIQTLEDQPSTPGQPPYKGLTFYDTADEQIFFGRRDRAQKICEMITTQSFVAVVGGSGSGKSSLVRAAVLPMLIRDGWNTLVLRPNVQPMLELLRALNLAATPSLSVDDLSAYNTQTVLQTIIALAASASAQRLVLVIDQFEEIFTIAKDKSANTTFVSNLLAAQAYPALSVMIVVRADFYHRLTDFADLPAAVAERQVYLTAMTREQITEVIKMPLQKHGWRIQEGLVEVILDDVGQEPGGLPFLSHALLETWRRRRSNVLTLSGYRETGGVKGAIAATAEEVWQTFTLNEQITARTILIELTELGERDGDQQLTPDTRRRRTYTDLAALALPSTELDTVLEALVWRRLLTRDHDQIEVAHEALIRAWPRLQAWLDADRDRLRLQRQIQTDATNWAQHDQNSSYLYTGVRLTFVRAELATKRISLHPLAHTFINASQKIHRRNRFFQFGIGIVLFTLLLITLLIQQNSLAAQRSANATIVANVTAQAGAAATIQVRATAEVRARSIALSAKATAETSNAIALNQARLAKAGELAAAAGREVAQPVFESSLALLLAIRAVTMTQPSDGPVFINATTALDEVVRKVSPWRMTLLGHTGDLTSAVFSPTGKHILTGSYDDTARIWDTETGQLLYTLQGHTDSVTSAVFSPDGKRILTGSNDDTARIWSAETGQPLNILQGHTGYILSASFNRSGDIIATASVDGSVRIWNSKFGQLLHVIQAHTSPVLSATFSLDSHRIVTVSSDRSACVWDTQTAQMLYCLQDHGISIVSAIFSSDGLHIVTGSFDNTPRIWEARTGKLLYKLEGHTNSAPSVCFSPDGQYIVTGSTDKTARIWNANTGQLIHTLRGHTSKLTSVIFSPDGGRVVTTSEDKTARIWDAETGQYLYALQGHSGSVVSASFSSDGQKMVTAGDQSARIWAAEIGQTLHVLQGHTETVMAATFSSDDRYIITASYDNTVRIWDSTTGQELYQLQSQPNRIISAVFSPDDKHIVTTNDNSIVYIWDVESGKELHQLGGTRDGLSLTNFSPDSKYIVIPDYDSTVRIWDIESGQELYQLQGHNNSVNSAAFSPNGNLIVTASADKTARIWASQTGQLLQILQGHKNSVKLAVFSPDSQHVITTSDDNTARIWNVTTGRPLYLLQGHTDRVFAVAYSPDGHHIVTASLDRTVRLWDADTGQLQHILQGRISRLTSSIFTPDSQYFVITNNGKIAQILDIKTGSVLFQLQGHTADIFSAAFSQDGMRIVTASADRSARIWFTSVNEYLTVAHRLIQRDPPIFTPAERVQYGLNEHSND